MAISDLPGYVQGYKFTDSPAFYDSTNKYFIDQAGFSANPASRAEVAVGSPTFIDVNAARGWQLDNTCHAYFNCPVAQVGSIIAVMGWPGWVTAGTENATVLHNNGSYGNFAGTPKLYIQHSSGQHNHKLWLPSGVSSAGFNYGDRNIYATAFSVNPTIGEKRVEAMDAAGTVADGGTVSDNQIGLTWVGGTTGYEVPGTSTYRQIIGAVSADPASQTVVASGNYPVLCELHFFTGNLTDAPTTAVEAELTALEVIYG